MDISKVTISCVKSDCQGVASLQQSVCGVCQTPVQKRYLTLLSFPTDTRALPEPETILGDRYWVTAMPNVVLDMTPAEPPVLTDEFPPEIEVYLKLSTHLLHTPKVFGLSAKAGYWLLEYPSVALGESGLPRHPQLFPDLNDVWDEADALQQLNWLLQIAGMLPTFLTQGVGHTFLDLSRVGINGGVVQIREFQFEATQDLDFRALGETWKPLFKRAGKSILGFCRGLYKSLNQGLITDASQLQQVLATGVTELGHSNYKYDYSIYTQTDTGPTREHNEDACFPQAGEAHLNSPLAIVCDGIGGHDKGEVASHIAIETLEQELLSPSNALDAIAVTEAVYAANDAISARNDEENRQERERMGTTVVMALAQQPHIHLCHVGDSRIYRITPDSCHQVTYDDDLGSREVRLGYALYQDMKSYPSAGALIQALGMNPSRSLHPTTQTFAVDCDTVYLLCSDGLSDYDRVDQYWQTEIAPLFEKQPKKRSMQAIGERLIEIANVKNGHDNATIALLYVRLKRQKSTAIAFPDRIPAPIQQQIPQTEQYPPETERDSQDSAPLTEASTPLKRQQKNWILTVIGLLGVVGIAWLSYGMWRRSQPGEILAPSEPSPAGVEPSPLTDKAPETPTITIPDDTAPKETIVDTDVLTKNQIVRLRVDAPLMTAYVPQAIANPDAPKLLIPGGSVVQIEQVNAEGQILLKSCVVGAQTEPTPAIKIIEKGKLSWITPEQVETQRDVNFVITPEIEASCEPTTPNPNTSATE